MTAVAPDLDAPLTPEQSARAGQWVGLARRVAWAAFEGQGWAGQPAGIDDLLDAALTSLVGAARRWNPGFVSPHTGRPVSFQTYAYRCMTHACKRKNLDLRPTAVVSFADPADERDHGPAEPTLADDAGEREAVRDRVRSLLGRLSAVEAAVMCRRFGLWDGDAMTVDETAADLGMTTDEVQAAEGRAVEKMRRAG